MKKLRCINIDWLEVYCTEDTGRFPCDADYFHRAGWNVKEREYGTRVYRQMFTLCDWNDYPKIEIRRDPASCVARDGGIFPPNACHIRLSNYQCYCASPIDFLRDFLATHNYTLMKIYRIDIALDFEFFDRGDDPAKFIERYMRGKYSKINQANIAAHGVDQWNGRVWNSLSWGQPKSMVSTKLYCKTLELAQAKDKPYIKLAWFDAHMIDDPINMTKRRDDGTIYKPDIYRVEFSIKSSAKKVFVIDKAIGGRGKIEMPHTLDIYDTPFKLETMFASLAMHYFHFKYYEENQRKDRCKDKILFEFSPTDTFYKLDRLASHTAKTKPEQRLINLLRNYSLTHPAKEVGDAVNILCNYIEQQILQHMNIQGTSQTDIKALQLLIAQRSRGIKQASLQRQFDQLKELLNDTKDLF